MDWPTVAPNITEDCPDLLGLPRSHCRGRAASFMMEAVIAQAQGWKGDGKSPLGRPRPGRSVRVRLTRASR